MLNESSVYCVVVKTKETLLHGEVVEMTGTDPGTRQSKGRPVFRC